MTILNKKWLHQELYISDCFFKTGNRVLKSENKIISLIINLFNET